MGPLHLGPTQGGLVSPFLFVAKHQRDRNGPKNGVVEGVATPLVPSLDTCGSGLPRFTGLFLYQRASIFAIASLTCSFRNRNGFGQVFHSKLHENNFYCGVRGTSSLCVYVCVCACPWSPVDG